MLPTLFDTLQRWQRHDLGHRLIESALRSICWTALILGLLPRAAWMAASALALLGEATWIWRRWRSPMQVAEAVDAAAGTHGLLHTALAAENDRAWGSPELLALVQTQARGIAPGLTEHAIRRFRIPRAPLAIGILATIYLLLPVPSETGEPHTRLEATLMAPVEDDEPPVEADESTPLPVSPMGTGEGSLADGNAQAWAERGDGEAGSTGAAGNATSNGQAQQGAEGVSGRAEDANTPTNKNTSSDLEAESAGDENQLSAGGVARQDIAEDSEVKETEMLAEHLEEGTARSGNRIVMKSPSDTDNDALQEFNTQMPEEEYSDLDNAVGSGNMLPEDSSALTQDLEDTPTNTVGLAMAGQGGINDAPGTVNLLEAPEESALETTEEWIAVRWRASSAGTLQTIDGGQSGGQSNQAWVELYTNYAAVAEARMHREEIPPGRRGYVSAYFESIRSEP